MNCHQCNKEFTRAETKIQVFDKKEPTTIYVFCSETCKKKWEAKQKK